MRRRAPAGVDPVDLPHVHARPLGQPRTSERSSPARQRLEAVEQRVDHDRRQVEREHGEAHHAAAAGQPPVAREAAHQRHGDRAADGGEDRLDRRSTCATSPSQGPALGGQAHVDRALVRHGRQRQRRPPSSSQREPGAGRRARRARAAPGPLQQPRGRRAADAAPAGPASRRDGEAGQREDALRGRGSRARGPARRR